MPHIFSISELTQAIKEVLESEFPLIWVRGQIGDLSRPGSGHLYFSLKDEQACLQAVWFKSNQSGSQAGEVLQALQTGREVLCAGRLAVYPPRGVYQLIAEQVELFGAGKLHLQFEALKKKLADQGWFAIENKQALPRHPERIGVITAPSGAALKDFLRLCSDRGWPGQIRIYPSLVQGQEAESNLVCALQEANLEKWAQVLVLIRGGGSLEDLWCFNSEELARSIHDSEIPVVTGIGHEKDLTISDLVADLRAATPSHAAQLLWPEKSYLLQQLDELEAALQSGWARLHSRKLEYLQQMERAMHWLSPWQALKRYQTLLQEQARALPGLINSHLQQKMTILQETLFRLSRTYTRRDWEYRSSSLQELETRLLLAARQQLQSLEQKEQDLSNRLQQQNPLLPLEKGYCLVQVAKDQNLLRSRQQVEPGDLLWIRTGADCLQARVED